MKVDVPILYKITHRPPRCRKLHETHVRDTHAVTITEATAAEARVAADFEDGERRSQGFDRELAFRWWDGRLWCADGTGVNDLAGRIALHGTTPKARPRAEAVADPEFGNIVDESARPPAVDYVERRAAEFLLVDGTVHVSAPEPFWEVFAGDVRARVVANAMFVGGLYAPLDKPHQFRADEFDAAMALARMHTPKAEPAVRGTIRLRDPSVPLRHDPQLRMAKTRLDELVQSLASGPGSLGSPAAAGRLAADLLRRLCEASGWSAHERMVARRALLDAATE